MNRNTSPKRTSHVLVVLVFLAVLMGIGSPALAQQTDKEKIEHLEQALASVKAQLEAGEDVAATLDSLEAEIQNLRSQVAQVSPPDTTKQPEAGVQGAPNPLQDDTRYLTGDDLLDDSFPSSLPIPGTGIRFRVGGYIKADFIADLDYVGDKYEFELATIPVEGDPLAAYGGQFSAQAKESRINFDFRSRAVKPSGEEFPMQVFLEMDFFEDNPALFRQPRLRHAYGVIGRMLVGQSWNISGDLVALAGTIDFSGGDALYGGRVTQIRWQDRINKLFTYAVGLEDPALNIGNPLGLDGRTRTTLPNAAGRIKAGWGSGSHIQLGGDLFQLHWQGGESGPWATAIGYGANLTTRLVLGKDSPDAIVAGGTIGKGSAHRVISLSLAANDAVITENGLDVMAHWQAYVGISHYWSDSFNSTASTNWAQLDNSEFQPGDAIHTAGSFHANLVWFPYKLVSTGVEVMWGMRENKDGARGEAVRIQAMAKFKFN